MYWFTNLSNHFSRKLVWRRSTRLTYPRVNVELLPDAPEVQLAGDPSAPGSALTISPSNLYCYWTQTG